jgi:hypothetical protein
MHRQLSEPACYGVAVYTIQGSQTLSRYGETRWRLHARVLSLTLGIALDAPVQAPLGFHRFEPVI